MNRDRERIRSRSRSPRRNGGPGRFPPRSDNKLVYLSNLPYELRWMELKSMIREKAGEVNFVEIIEERGGRSKGCAVAEFPTAEQAAAAIEKLHAMETHGRRIVAKDIRDPDAFFRKIKEDTGIDFTSRSGGRPGGGDMGRPRRRSPSPRGGPPDGNYELFGLSPSFLRQHQIQPPLCCRIFVANLVYNVTSGVVWEMFAMAGKVVFVDLQTDKEGKSKGNAVIEFSHPLEAVQAISMFNNQKFHDRGLVVKMDRYDKRKPLGKGELPKGLASVGMGLGAAGAPLLDIASLVPSMVKEDVQPSFVESMPNPFGPSHMAPPQQFKQDSFMGGGFVQRGGFDMGMAPQPVVEQQPVGSFSYGGPPQPGPPRQEPPRDSFNRAPQQYAPPVQQTYSQPVGGQFTMNREPFQPSAPNGNPAQFVKKEEYPPAYGGYGDSARAPTASFTSSRTILIKNLPGDYTWQIVRDRSSNFGEVESCDLVQPGVARVRFSANSEAERARGALAGTSVEGRPITVDFVM